MLTSLPISLLSSSAPSLFVPPLMHPQAQFLCHVVLRFYKGAMPGSSCVPLFAASTGEPLLSARRICPTSSWDRAFVFTSTVTRCNLQSHPPGKVFHPASDIGASPGHAPSLDHSSSFQYGCILSMEICKDFVPSSWNFYDSFVCI